MDRSIPANLDGSIVPDPDTHNGVQGEGTSSNLRAKPVAAIEPTLTAVPVPNFDAIPVDVEARNLLGSRKTQKHVNAMEPATTQTVRQKKLTSAARTILECIGENGEREGLLNTPERFARGITFCTEGYEQNLSDIVNGAVFHEDHGEMVIVKNIEITSLCEHHLLPFVGKMHVGYLPKSRVLGLSKFARIANMFSRRLQIQERLTRQVAEAIVEVLAPSGAAVVVECTHMCMVMRGVQQTHSQTTTSCMLGVMKSEDWARLEFLRLIA